MDEIEGAPREVFDSQSHVELQRVRARGPKSTVDTAEGFNAAEGERRDGSPSLDMTSVFTNISNHLYFC